MLHAEYLPTLNPPEVRITGEPRQVALLSDGLNSMQAASTVAEMGGQPFVCTPSEAEQACMEWAQSLRGRDPEIRQVSPGTAALAYRGLVRAHARLVEDGAVQHGSSAGNVPFAKRRQQMNRAIGDLAQLRARLIEGGHLPLPGFTRPSAG